MRRDDKKLTRYFCNAPADISLAHIDLEHLPSHIAFIMDGNGRWAQARGLDRTKGHKAGVAALREVITASVRLGIDVLSAYAFSTENWKRPQTEVDLLMHLFATTLMEELPLFHQEHVRLVFLGDLTKLPAHTQAIFQQGLDETASYDGMVLALAVNYGGRAELVRAAQKLADAALRHELDPAEIDEKRLASCLYTHELPDPELLVRTSGEFRLSNFFLWQLAYTELYIADVLWPDFGRWDLLRVLYTYQNRDRRFGGIAV